MDTTTETPSRRTVPFINALTGGGKTSPYAREVPEDFRSSFMRMLIEDDASLRTLQSAVRAVSLRHPASGIRLERHYPHDENPVYSVVSGHGDKRRVFIQGMVGDLDGMTVEVVRNLSRWITRLQLQILAR